MQIKLLTLVRKFSSIFVALCTYTMGAFFNFQLFSQQGGQEVALSLIYGLLGVVFDVMKVTFTAEGLMRKQFSIIALAICFSLVSLTSSALNMLSSWVAAVNVEKNDPTEILRESLLAKRTTLQAQLSSEQARLDKGSVQYRTDAKETRESIVAIQAQVDEVNANILKLPPKTLREAQTQQGFFGAIPLENKSRSWLNLGFRLLIAVLLELGGWSSIYILVGNAKEKTHTPSAAIYTLDKNNVAHIVERTSGIITRTLCARAFAGSAVDWSKKPVICPECTRRNTNA